jgi:hypothetical protein
MATVTLKSSGLSMDTTAFKDFAKALRRAQPVLARGLRARLREAGELVAAEARSNLSGVSTSIPPTIKVRTSGAGVAVVAGGNGKPLAGLFELGNQGRSGGTTFRHRVFGSDTWVEQPMHPFLYKALESKAEEAEALVVEALDAAIAEAVL